MNITVTKPFMPPYSDFKNYLEGIWSREWLTNNGPLLNELEIKLKEHLDVDHLLFLCNGTVAIQIAIRALDLVGEIITTPFSYVATTSSIVWERCDPVMVDICPDTLNIDASKIEQAITEKTTAILATHVFGNSCDVDAIHAIAEKHNLKVIYDAAHAFGTLYKGKSLLAYGDVSTCSFHSTKLFHTVEGGAVISPHASVLKQMAMMRNFGHSSATEFGSVGINGKNSEFHAAMGLCNLKHVPDILSVRRTLSERYKSNLEDLPIQFQKIQAKTEYNYAYFPVIFESEAKMLKLVEFLNLHSIFPRRYFYPSLTKLPYVYEQSAPIAEDISRRIICLPLYHTLSIEEVDMICRFIKQELSCE
ncbi:dTDP-4-amino-4,6-dideoxygalactose transaminase [Pseudomonas sp. 3296]|uniref:DegT/DnrJ/EryC1/StrS family aminotransferase n=1 Tax=Pseudomonas sp. 3296 TaxID=2817753 RepID=UPI002856988C|nr:DegT/DnrJ/EryC1/StrS family aminotransferase [Pseudomonas sp. 3296]MDR6918655.1 dTDP-4-amino-4,6-dideoxygalactose transaminase [Pseudomonas sp. 3296]